MPRILTLVIVILFLCAPATFASEIEFQEGLNSSFGFMPAEFDFEHAAKKSETKSQLLSIWSERSLM